MDFTYVALKDGTFRYKCTIIDLFDRSVIASENSRQIRQSMSRAGYPYDNAPMERYFNTLKTELLNVHEYSKEKELYKAINDFAYILVQPEPHAYIHTTITKHLMKFALQHNNQLQVLQFWLTKVKTWPSTFRKPSDQAKTASSKT